MTESDIQDMPNTETKEITETKAPQDATYFLETLLNVFAKTIDPNAIITLESVKTGSESELMAGLDSFRKLDFVSEYLLMHIYTNQALPPRALRLMTYLGEYYSKTPVLEQHYLPEGFVARPNANGIANGNANANLSATVEATAADEATGALALETASKAASSTNLEATPEVATAADSVSETAALMQPDGLSATTMESAAEKGDKTAEAQLQLPDTTQQENVLQDTQSRSEVTNADFSPPLETAGWVAALSLVLFFAVWVALKVVSRNPVHEI